MKDARGVIDSGIPDLASNPEHLKGFGRDGRANLNTSPNSEKPSNQH